MRSNLIYGAVAPIQNRYLLCQLVSKATRKFHRPNTRIQETMNDVLNRFSHSTEPGRLARKSELPVAEVARQAA